jgi:hypothetical protein
MARHLLSDVIASLRRSAWMAEDNLRRTRKEPPRFAELAVEFECRITPRWNPRRRCADALLHMGRPRVSWFDRRPVHRVRIVCRAADRWKPSVRIDGRPWKSETHR